MKYITEPKGKTKGCLFCRVIKETRDRENLVILRSESVFAILNKFPYNNGHLMIAPYRHTGDISSLTNPEIIDLFCALKKMKEILKEILKPDGFNIGINIGRVAGAGIPGHIHMHIVPRWKEDANFMPAISQTKVICQSLEELYAQLHKRI